MKLLVVFSALVCLCAGQGTSYTRAQTSAYEDPAPSSYDSSYRAPTYNQGPTYGQGPSYVPTTYGRHAPAYGSYGPGYDTHRDSYAYERDQRVIEQLKVLESLIETREAVQDAQFERVAGVRDEANENVDFANNFNEYIYAEINNEQYQQNSRLDRLEQRIAEINAIRQSVNELTETTDAINEQVAKETDYQKAFHSELKDIENDAADRANTIVLTQQRADHVAERIDYVEDRIAENTRSLDILETNVRRTIDSVNRMRAQSEDIVIQPGVYQEPTVVPFEPPFVGAPQSNNAYVVGVHITNPASYAQHGYPTIYYGIEEEIWNVRSEISASDMSSGNFVVNTIAVTTDNVYFDNTVYTKDAFDGIVTDNFAEK